MNKRNIIINILIILITIITLSSIILPNYCYAKDKLGLGKLDNYEGTNPGSEKLEKKANMILGYIRNIGIILSVIILIVIGIKYMMGSVEEKANYKQTLLPYLIGAVLVFTGSLIPQLIYIMMQNF